ncbi:MAG: S9 family peptidase [Chitinophagaceae bacterium]|nr:S9 family peptidase [Chitinophagaceae bacterium]
MQKSALQRAAFLRNVLQPLLKLFSIMRLILILFLAGILGFGPGQVTFAQSFTLESALSYPFPSELTASPDGSKIAVAINQKGLRNIYVAEGPDFTLRQLTSYAVDDGQEISGITFTRDGSRIVYTRGGDHGAYDETVPRNPSSFATAPKIQLYSIAFTGGAAILLDEGDDAAVSPDNKTVAYIKNRQARIAAADGSVPAHNLFTTKGNVGGLQWSPDGKKLLFTAFRGDHSFIGIFRDSASPIQWIDPSFARDQSPKWSPDGNHIVFVRRPAAGGKPDSVTVNKHEPWAIYTADITTGKAVRIWKAPETLRGSVPATNGRYNLHWATGNRIVFVSYEDGWPHLYSMPAVGGNPMLLTPGNFMVEHVKLSPDKKWIVFSASTGPDKYDYERRHLARVPVDKAAMEILTPGDGIETFPVVTGDGNSIAFLSAGTQRPAALAVIPFNGGKTMLTGKELIPPGFPSTQFVTPKSVTFKAADGKTAYGQLFEPANKTGKKPAIVFIHGGPQRQMLLGWHYGDYYANTYALNQYLVSKGFIVLSVNYRLGIGYGYEFQNPEGAWNNGASEYLDIKAAGDWLSSQPAVDVRRIGIYGGSYGGFLTAMALAKDSKLFAAGVDIHGEHNLMVFAPEITKEEQAPDVELARKLIWQSSPVAYIHGWTSPVLIIHGDDDGNVPFKQSVDLVRRFEEKKFTGFETLVIPDETHHWMKFSNQLKVDEATAEFLIRKLGEKK